MFVFLFSSAAQGMDIVDKDNTDNKEETFKKLDLNNIVNMGVSSNGGETGKKVVINTKGDMSNLIRAKTTELSKRKNVGDKSSPVNNVESLYTPRERKVIDQTKNKYNLTPEKLELLAELKKEYELDHDGLVAVMKKNINARDHSPRSWEKAQLDKKIKEDPTLKEAIQLKALIKMINQAELDDQATSQSQIKDTDNDGIISLKQLYTDMTHAEIKDNQTWLRRAGYAIGGLAITIVGQFAGLLIPLLMAKIGVNTSATL